MRLSSEHDSNYLRLGLILVFTGFLFALIFVTRVNARELSPQIFDTEAVLVYDNDPLSVYGCDHALYFYQDSLNDEILLSSSFNPEIEQLYDHWYGSRVMDSVRSWGFNYLSYDILKGHIINLMSRTNTFWISRYDTISNVELKELVLDDSYEAFYFMDSNFNYYCYVSYIPQNSETLQPDYPFDSFTINDSGLFVEQDSLYRELFVWDLSNQRWVYSSVSSSDVVVHTVLRSPSGVRLESGAQVFVEASRFLIDEPLPSATPTASPSPAPEPEFDSVFFKFSYNENGSIYYKLVEINAEDFGFSVPLNRVSSSFLNFVASNHGVQLESVSGASFVMRSGASGYNIGTTSKNAFWVYFTAESLNFVKIYSIPDVVSYAKDPLELIDSYTGSDISHYPNYFCQFSSPTVSNVYGLVFSQAKVSTPNWIASFSLGDVYGFDYVLQSISSTSSFSADGNYYSNSESSNAIWVIGYDGLYGLLGSLDIEPNPNGPTPSPLPSPTPTEAPHVIITWPTGSPTPTPPFVIPSMPPLNPPGDGITPLDPELQEDVFGVFKSKIGDNNSFGLFGLLIGLLPGDLMWYIWFLLFVLLVVGVAKLFIHFTGG